MRAGIYMNSYDCRNLYRSLLEAGEALGLRKTIGERELNSMMAALPGALSKFIQEVSDENTRLPLCLSMCGGVLSTPPHRRAIVRTT